VAWKAAINSFLKKIRCCLCGIRMPRPDSEKVDLVWNETRWLVLQWAATGTLPTHRNAWDLGQECPSSMVTGAGYSSTTEQAQLKSLDELPLYQSGIISYISLCRPNFIGNEPGRVACTYRIICHPSSPPDKALFTYHVITPNKIPFSWRSWFWGKRLRPVCSTPRVKITKLN